MSAWIIRSKDPDCPYLCAPGMGSCWGGLLSDAYRFRTRQAAERALKLEKMQGPPDDPPYIVRVVRRCPVQGRLCERHGFVHGQEAEELRSGIEDLVRGVGSVGKGQLQALLDSVDARDSLAFVERSTPPITNSLSKETP